LCERRERETIMPSAQEHRLKKEEEDDENATNVASEPSSRTYTPPLPPLATPEYVRYLQEQRIGTTTPSQTASGDNSDSEGQPPPTTIQTNTTATNTTNTNNNNNNNNTLDSVRPSFTTGMAREAEAGNEEQQSEKARRRNEDETFAPIIGPDRNPSLSGSRANSHEDLASLNARAVMNEANERYKGQVQDIAVETQKRNYTELKDVAISLSEDPDSPRHRKNITANFPRLGTNKGWLRVDATGRLTKLTIEKHKISHMLRVPIRDLRVLEPTMSSSYSTSIWCRERSIVVNLEQIKILITAEEVICPDSKNSAVVERYVPELQRRLQRRIKMKESSEKEDKTHKKNIPETFSSFALNEAVEKSSKEKEHHERKPSNSSRGYTSFDEEEMKGHEGGHHRTSFDTFGGATLEGSEYSSEGGSDETLPFELIALEVALEMVCNALEVESDKVEREGKPQLEKLRQDVNQTNLEKVRRVKNRLVRINARVSKVREEIQRYLDDDSDMRDLYLTRRLREELRQNSARSNRESGATPSPAGARGRGLSSQPPLSPLNQSQRTPNQVPASSPNANSSQVQIIGPNGEVWDEDKDLQEVEDLFETYFTHIDSTFRNLEQLNEYIDDMEDLIEIELDSKRNQLIKLELLLTAGTLCLSGFGVVVGVFGMNIKNGLEGSQSSFELVIVFSVLGSVLTFVAIVQACRYFRLF